MDSILRVEKQNKRRNKLSISNTSRSSFGSFLQSIRQIDKIAQEEQYEFKSFNIQKLTKTVRQIENPITLQVKESPQKLINGNRRISFATNNYQQKSSHKKLQIHSNRSQNPKALKHKKIWHTDAAFDSVKQSQRQYDSQFNFSDDQDEQDHIQKPTSKKASIPKSNFHNYMPLDQKESIAKQRRNGNLISQTKMQPNKILLNSSLSMLSSSYVLQAQPRILEYANKFSTSSQQKPIPSGHGLKDSKVNNLNSIRSDMTYGSRALHTRSIIPKTNRRAEPVRQFTIAIIQYCSHELGMAAYNQTTGQFHLCQLVENMTYFRTLSTVRIFSPIQIIFPPSMQKTFLLRRLKDDFPQTVFRTTNRRDFDDFLGQKLYKDSIKYDELNTGNKFLAFACYNALISYLQNSLQTTFKQKSLKINWHRLDKLLIIDPDTVIDLEIFQSNQKNGSNSQCFMDCFKCITYGGTRMLRANLLQPSSAENLIMERQQLVQKFLQNPSIVSCIQKQFYRYKYYEPVTAKFIQSPRQQNFKSLKSFLSSIFLLSNQCMSLDKLYKTLNDGNAFQLPILQKLDLLLQSPKLQQIKHIITQNFDQNILKNHQQAKRKKDKFIYLFKVQKIQNENAPLMRQAFTQTVRNIRSQYESIKRRTHQDIQLLHNDYRGYFLKTNDNVDLQNLSQSLGQNIVQISVKGRFVTFSTQIISSLNNRLKETQKVLILQSQSLLRRIIVKIQQNIDILFQINNIMSTIDMVISFTHFIDKYSQFTKFIRPKFIKNKNFKIENIRPIWMINIQNSINQYPQFSIIKQNEQKQIMVLEKSQNSTSQNVYMFSIAYTVILCQIGCFIPATSVEISLYDSLLSKIQIQQHTQLGMSRFQLTLVKLQNILDNCFDQNSSKCLILMDEIVKGTQHQQQCALSLAIIKELLNNCGLVVVSTSDRMFVRCLAQDSELFQGVETIKTGDYDKEQDAIQQMTRNATQAMNRFNFNPLFIDFFQEIKTVLKDQYNQNNQDRISYSSYKK